MAKHKLDPNRPYTPPENEAEYKKQLHFATRNYLWALDDWAGKLDASEHSRVMLARAVLKNLMEVIDQL